MPGYFLATARRIVACSVPVSFAEARDKAALAWEMSGIGYAFFAGNAKSPRDIFLRAPELSFAMHLVSQAEEAGERTVVRAHAPRVLDGILAVHVTDEPVRNHLGRTFDVAEDAGGGGLGRHGVNLNLLPAWWLTAGLGFDTSYCVSKSPADCAAFPLPPVPVRGAVFDLARSITLA